MRKLACTLALLLHATAAVAADRITVGGQSGWRHDEGDASGTFHTFDALDLPGSYRRARKVHVFQPRSATGGGSGRRYPVLYMNDGSNAFFSDGGQGSWRLAARLSELYRQGALREIIVVGIVSPDRDEEYTHAAVPTVTRCCGLANYARYIAEQLKPWIDRHYPTLPGRATTGVLGSSHGGLAAFATAARAPASFGAAAALSPSFWVKLDPFGPEADLADSTLLRWLGAGLAPGGDRPRVYVDWGLVRTGGMHNSLIERHAAERGAEMVDLLRDSYDYRAGDELAWHEDPSGAHDEASWGRRVGRVLQWMFGPATAAREAR